MIRIAHSQGIMDCNAPAMPVAIFFSIETPIFLRKETDYSLKL